MSGSKAVGVGSNYTTPLPGGVLHHTMSIYSGYIFVFGGEGFANSGSGILCYFL